MNKIFLLFSHELQILMKDRQALGLLFIMPLIFILFLTLVLQDVYLAKVGKKVRLEFVTSEPCDSSPVCRQLLGELRRMEYDIHVTTKLTNERLEMALVLPENIGQTVELVKQNKPLSEKDQVQLIFDPVLDQSVRALVEANLMMALQSVLIEQVKTELKDAGANEINTIADVHHFSGLVMKKAWNGMILPNPIQQTVPAWALFGMFFIVIPMANSMIRDRKLGIFKRLLSFPVGRGQILAGKILPFLVLNVLQFALMFCVGIFVLPRITNLNIALDFSLWHIAAVTAACAFAATSYGLMVSCLARTSEQASAFGALSVVILAVVSGVMVPRFVMPEFMQQVSLVSPLYWGLEAYLDLIVRKTAFAEALNKILMLLAFGSAFLAVSRWRFRWSEME